MKVLIDNEEIRISLSEEFIKLNTFLDGKSLGDFILENTLEKFKLYRKIFNVDKLEKICFEIYDVVTEKDVWKDRYISFYGKNPPEYSLGFFEPDCNLSCTCVHANAAYGTGWWNSAVSDKEIFQRKDVFNGYLASVLIIKYLSDSYGEGYLFDLMRDNYKIKEIGSNVLPEMIDYFRRKFRIIDSKKL